MLKSYRANESIMLHANPNFWRGAPKIDSIQYVYYTNSDAQVQALRAGDVDFVAGLTPTQFEALEKVDGITAHSGRDVAITRSPSTPARSRATVRPSAPATRR